MNKFFKKKFLNKMIKIKIYLHYLIFVYVIYNSPLPKSMCPSLC